MRLARIPHRLLLLPLLLALLLAACNRGPGTSEEQGHAAASAITEPPDSITLAYLGSLRGFQRPCG